MQEIGLTQVDLENGCCSVHKNLSIAAEIKIYLQLNVQLQYLQNKLMCIFLKSHTTHI